MMLLGLLGILWAGLSLFGLYEARAQPRRRRAATAVEASSRPGWSARRPARRGSARRSATS